MKKTVKILLTLLAITILLSVFAVSSFAVPKYNGNGEEGACKSHTNKLVTLDDIPDRVPTGSVRGLQKVNTKKNIPLVIVVIGFNNVSYSDSYNWGDTIFQGEESLKKYYSDMSFGQFTFEPVTETSKYGVGGNTNKHDAENDGIIHVKLNSDHDNWSLQPGVLMWNQNVNLTKALIQAVKSANAYIDFSQYDANGNGLIENNEMALGFVFAGYEAAYQTSYNTFSFWSHAFSISESIEAYNLSLQVPTVDGVKVDSYIGIAEKLEKDKQEPICVLAHELGHYLGLPDLYDTYYSTSNEWSDYSVEHLSVMCSGVWCEDEENETFIPSSMDAWSRYELGWISPKRVTENGTFTLTSQNYDNQSEKISTVLVPTQTTNEYYIIENRQFTGWDRFLNNYFYNDNGGVVIWHVDKNIYNENYEYNSVNNTDHRPSVMPLYPEKNNSAFTFIGSDDVVYSPFFDSEIWSGNYSANLGNALNLPLYGKGSKADKRSSRTLSGITIGFTDECSDSMNISVNVDSHVHTGTHMNRAATCLLNGYNDCYYCTYCRKFFSDSASKNEISSTDAIIPALGHNFVFSKTVAPMADENGYDLYICSHCGEEKKENYKKLVGWGYDKAGNRYYAKKDGTFLKGWQTINGKRYYFNRFGIMTKKWAKLTNSKGNAYYYYFGDNGVMRTGWQSIKNSKGVSYKYYFNQYGIMLTGWQNIKNSKGATYKYYFGTNGYMRTGWQSIKNSKGVAYKYYFHSNGVMLTSWQWIANSKGVKYRYYFGDNGYMRTGWQKIKNAKGVEYWYYFYSNGVNAINRNVKIGNKTYKFNKYGVCTNR